MPVHLPTNHQPVKRQSAEGYLLVMLIAFASSVILTRLYLDATGYPQIGGDVYHIAHVLWGGLLMFAGALLPLTFYNRIMFLISALLTGAGVGLFIDEVGKFITVSNDYFFPLAAPIIYVFFVGTVILYLRVRARRPRGPRGSLYRALDRLTDIVDHDLSQSEKRDLLANLNSVLTDDGASDDMKALAMALLEALNDPALDIIPDRESWWEKLIARLKAFEKRWFSLRVMRLLLIAALAAFGITSLTALTITLVALFDPASRETVIGALLLSSELQTIGSSQVTWLFVLWGLQSLIGLLVLFSAALLALRRDHAGSRLALLALIVNLTTVNLLIFYYEQFAAVIATMAQVALILALLRFRQRFISPLETVDVLSKVLKPPGAVPVSAGEVP